MSVREINKHGIRCYESLLSPLGGSYSMHNSAVISLASHSRLGVITRTFQTGNGVVTAPCETDSDQSHAGNKLPTFLSDEVPRRGNAEQLKFPWA